MGPPCKIGIDLLLPPAAKSAFESEAMTQEEIFAKAIGLSPSEQADFLDQMYAHRPQDRARMEAMLAAHVQSDSLLDSHHDRRRGRCSGPCS